METIYILKRIENGTLSTIMETTSLESARRQGEDLKEGYAIYKSELVEYADKRK